MEATGSSGASGHCSGSLLSQRQGTHGDSLFPAGCTGSFKTCLCRLSKNCPDWSCHCSLSLSRLLEVAASKSKPTFKSVEGTACSWILPAQSHLPAISPMHPGHLKVKGRQGCLSAPLPPPCWKGQPFLCSSKFQQRSRTQCHLISNPPTLTARPGNSR